MAGDRAMCTRLVRHAIPGGTSWHRRAEQSRAVEKLSCHDDTAERPAQEGLEDSPWPSPTGVGYRLATARMPINAQLVAEPQEDDLQQVLAGRFGRYLRRVLCTRHEAKRVATC
jgi:hypothetical protein